MNLQGTLVAVPTILTEQRSIDTESQTHMARYLLDGGVEGIVALGSSGEGAVLEIERRRVTLKSVVEGAGGGDKVVAGCLGNGIRAVEEGIELAADTECGAVLVPPPFYYAHSQTDLIDYYTYLASISPLPIVLYHIPERTVNALTIDSISRLATMETIVGIKDSSGDFSAHLELLNLQSESFVVLQGVAALLSASYSAGASGSITPVAVMSDLELGLRRSIQDRSLDRANIHAALIGKVARMLRMGGLPLVTNLKVLVQLLGLGERWVEPPTPTAPEEHVEGFSTQLSELRLQMGNLSVPVPEVFL